MGVAPPETLGRISSAPPWAHAGNLDNKELVAATTLLIPVHARGALFSVGDAHAGQGNGKVSLTALETVLVRVFRFNVRKARRLRWPRAEPPTHHMTSRFSSKPIVMWCAEPPTHHMTMGFDENLDVAVPRYGR